MLLAILSFLSCYFLSGKALLCNYAFALGKPYAPNWCNSEVTIDDDKSSWKVRCLANGTAVLDYFYNTNCSGIPEETSQLQDYRCDGTYDCDYALITTYYGLSSYYEDVPCGEQGSYYIEELVATGECLYEQQSGRTRFWNCSNHALTTIEYKESTCTNEKNTPNVKQDTCLDGSKNTTKYQVLCGTHTPTFAPTVNHNKNDANSCAYVSWNDLPVAPNECFTESRNGTKGKSVIFKCENDNSGVNRIDFTTPDCSGPSTITAWKYGFNCIGTTSCYSEWYSYINRRGNDSSCSNSTETIDRNVLLATETCISRDNSGSNMVSCDDTYLYFKSFSTNDCSGDITDETYSYKDGCWDQYDNNYFQITKIVCPNKDMSSRAYFIFDAKNLVFVQIFFILSLFRFF